VINKPLRGVVTGLALAAALAMPALADTTPAAPRATHHHRHAAHRQRLAAVTPIRPFAPATPAHARDTQAPVPDPAITPPVDNSDQETSVAPAVMQIHYPPQGDGYVAGSSAQAMDDREAAKVTGVQVHVPLGQ